MDARMIVMGATLVAVPVLLTIPFLKWCSEVDREQFERTNQYGVREYASYEEMRRNVRREATAGVIAKLLFVTGLISIVLGLILTYVGINIK